MTKLIFQSFSWFMAQLYITIFQYSGCSLWCSSDVWSTDVISPLSFNALILRILSFWWLLTNSKDSSEYSFKNKYFDALNHGGLIVPSTALSDFVSSSFAILDYAKDHIDNNLVRHTAELLLKKYAPKSIFACDQHSEEGFMYASRTVVNIFYNNKQKSAVMM